ncbi:MAG: hypothetical protein DMG69_23950 [Acidobacteria bacterium]|nr:MAG: hypothetical protein DMG69_23950 [Acidobacteriota bacterium]
MRDRFRAFAPSMLLWQFAAKQFHVNRMIIYNQTGADHIFTLNSHVHPHSGGRKRLLRGTRATFQPARNLLRRR